MTRDRDRGDILHWDQRDRGLGTEDRVREK